MQYFEFIDEIVKLRYNCFSSHGLIPKTVVISNETAQEAQLEDIVQILGIDVKIDDSLGLKKDQYKVIGNK